MRHADGSGSEQASHAAAQGDARQARELKQEIDNSRFFGSG
jgi:hypothetical protein